MLLLRVPGPLQAGRDCRGTFYFLWHECLPEAPARSEQGPAPVVLGACPAWERLSSIIRIMWNDRSCGRPTTSRDAARIVTTGGRGERCRARREGAPDVRSALPGATPVQSAGEAAVVPGRQLGSDLRQQAVRSSQAVRALSALPKSGRKTAFKKLTLKIRRRRKSRTRLARFTFALFETVGLSRPTHHDPWSTFSLTPGSAEGGIVDGGPSRRTTFEPRISSDNDRSTEFALNATLSLHGPSRVSSALQRAIKLPPADPLRRATKKRSPSATVAQCGNFSLMQGIFSKLCDR